MSNHPRKRPIKGFVAGGLIGGLGGLNNPAH